VTPGSNGQHDWVRAAATRLERPLLSYAARLFGGDVDAARDVVQDALLRLCDQDEREIAPHLNEWLYTVVRNRALDVLRKESRMSLLDESAADQRIATRTERDPAESAESRDTTESIIAMLDRLPPNQAEVIRLKFQHGLSYAQISGVTKLSVSNVGYLIHTGLKALRERLGARDVEKHSP
jgi:RNA polymerase sigma-70 factor (ECF subfamily)